LTFNVPVGYAAPQLNPSGPAPFAPPTVPFILQVAGLNNTSLTPYSVAFTNNSVAVTSGPLSGAAFPAGAIAIAGASPQATWATLSALPLSPLGPADAWALAFDTTQLPIGTYNGTFTFTATAAGQQFSNLVVPFVLNVTSFPQLTVSQPAIYPNPTFGTGISQTPVPGFCPTAPTSAPAATCAPTVIGLPLPAATGPNGLGVATCPPNQAPGCTVVGGVFLSGQAGNSTLSCAVIDVAATGGTFGPPFTGGVNAVSIAPLSVPWISVSQAPAQFLGVIPGGNNGAGFGVAGGFAPIPGVPPFAAGGPNTVVGTGLQTLQICANPSQLPAKSDVLTTDVIINAAGVSPQDVRVTFVVNSQTPAASATFSEIGVFRAAPSCPAGQPATCQQFVLNEEFTGQLTQPTPGYNFSKAITDGLVKAKLFGVAGDIPVAGDWNGTGTITIGVYRPSTGQWILDLNNNGSFDGIFLGDGIFTYGQPPTATVTDLPVVGDWNGDGRTKFGIYRCDTTAGSCKFILDVLGRKTFDNTSAVYTFGLPGDVPVANNWNGTTNQDAIGVFRLTPISGFALLQGQWIVDSNANGTFDSGDITPFFYGQAGDIPVVGNWGNQIPQRKRVGIFRPSPLGAWVLDVNGNNAYDVADPVFFFGQTGDVPVVGFYTIP
jgi:hypothetical protein